MIEAQETSLPEARQMEIVQWMTSIEAEEFLGSLKAEVAVLIAKSTRRALQKPHGLLYSPPIVEADAEEMMRWAARLQICIDVFEEKRSGEQPMISVSLKTI